MRSETEYQSLKNSMKSYQFQSYTISLFTVFFVWMIGLYQHNVFLNNVAFFILGLNLAEWIIYFGFKSDS